MKKFFKKIVVDIITSQARLVLAKYKPKIVAITGSVGKTSTKEAVYTVLSKNFRVRKTQKSYNSEIGLPLTILGCESGWKNPFRWLKNIIEGLALILFPNTYPEWLVLEVGADAPGDIKKITEWLKPDIAIITRIGELPVHVEFFASPAALAKEKSYLVGAVKPSGTVILCADDPVVLGMGDRSKMVVKSYGFEKGADFRASNERIIYDEVSRIPEGISYKLDYDGKILPVRLNGVLGRQAIFASLAALAISDVLNLNLLSAVVSLAEFKMPVGRMRLLLGNKATLILDDTYNSSPLALEAALDILKQLEIKGRRIGVLGDMMELGKYTIEAHKAAGFQVARTCDLLLVVGQRAKFIAEGAAIEGMQAENIHQFDDASSAGAYLDKLLAPGDLILVKGSQYMRMERAVEEVMAEPERKGELLARQEPEWQNR